MSLASMRFAAMSLTLVVRCAIGTSGSFAGAAVSG